MRKQLKIIGYILLASLILNAQEKTSIQPSMHTLFKNMQILFPYMSDEEKFTNPKNEKLISDKLKESAEAIKKLSTHSNSIALH